MKLVSGVLTLMIKQNVRCKWAYANARKTCCEI